VGCSLTAVGQDGTRSGVIDSPGEFVDFHFLYILDPTGGETYNRTFAICEMAEGNVLSCDVQGQNVLQLFGPVLSIASIAEDGATQGTFFLVPAS
jgi:hypothetical protein